MACEKRFVGEFALDFCTLLVVMAAGAHMCGLVRVHEHVHGIGDLCGGDGKVQAYGYGL